MRKAVLIAAATIAVLFAAAWWATTLGEVPRASLEKQYATPPSQFVRLSDGTRLHYRDRGPRGAPAILLLHGFSGTLSVWEPWSKALSDDFRVITLDLPGHGLTGATPNGDYSQAAMMKAVKELADQLGLKRFALAGNSMGGAVAARFAETYPERVSRLILIDAAGAKTSTRPRLHLAYMAARTPLLQHFFLWAVMRRMPPLSRMEGSPQAILAHFALPDDNWVWEHASAIRAPTLVMWGGSDKVIAPAAAEAWKKAVPGAKLILYPGAGHVAMADAPGPTSRDAKRFLSGIFPRQTAIP